MQITFTGPPFTQAAPLAEHATPNEVVDMAFADHEVLVVADSFWLITQDGTDDHIPLAIVAVQAPEDIFVGDEIQEPL